MSSLRSHQSANCPYPAPDQSSPGPTPHTTNSLTNHINIDTPTHPHTHTHTKQPLPAQLFWKNRPPPPPKVHASHSLTPHIPLPPPPSQRQVCCIYRRREVIQRYKRLMMRKQACICTVSHIFFSHIFTFQVRTRALLHTLQIGTTPPPPPSPQQASSCECRDLKIGMRTAIRKKKKSRVAWKGTE
jgi:hypothetical protein